MHPVSRPQQQIKAPFTQTQMKRLAAIVILLVSLLPEAFAQEGKREGYGLAGGPIYSYSTEKGFKIGAYGELFDYGDGTRYPEYRQKAALELSYYTKGTTLAHLYYDSKHLLPGIRLSAGATYVHDTKFDFYGFNGSAQPHYDELDSRFYSYQRDFLRLIADFSWGFAFDGRLRLTGGFGFWYWNIGRISDKLGYKLPTLFDVYRDYGLIHESEAAGGNHLEFRAGLSYDSRDKEAAPSRGTWAEVYLNYSPDLLRFNVEYLRLIAHFRQYFPLKDRLVLATHAAWQGTVGGETPFYMQQYISSLYLKQVMPEGLGGQYTLRGILPCKILGDSFFWANLELRWRFLDFKKWGQDWYLACNPFVDLGMLTSPYRIKELSDYLFVEEDILRRKATKLHETAGAGIKLGWNENFIMGLEAGVPFNREDGDFAFALGINYLF